MCYRNPYHCIIPPYIIENLAQKFSSLLQLVGASEIWKTPVQLMLMIRTSEQIHNLPTSQKCTKVPKITGVSTSTLVSRIGHLC